MTARLLIFLTVSIGGGSLLLLMYFLVFGAPLAVPLARTEPGKLAVDALLCLVFFVQHSGMIRRGAKDRLAPWIPGSHYPAAYSIASGLALAALVLLWQTSDHTIFRISVAGRVLSACVVLIAVVGFAWGARSLGAFDPFGQRALEASTRGVVAPPLAFAAEGAYRVVRHPLYLFMLLLIWSTPRFTTDQLLFNVLWTAWIVVGSRLEERDLVADFGDTYRRYQREVPMLIPSLRSMRRA